MIRKSILFIIVVLVAMWFAGAYLIQNRLTLIVENTNSDNIKFSYQNIRISGFPFSWKIKFNSPRVTIIDQESLRDLSIDTFNIRFNYLMKDASFNLGKTIYYSDAQDDLHKEYDLSSDIDINFNVHFKKSFGFMDLLSWQDFISSVNLYLPSAKVSYSNKEQFAISDIKANFIQNLNVVPSMVHVQLSGDYQSLAPELDINKAQLLLDIGYLTNNQLIEDKEQLDFDRKLEISKIKLSLDGSSLDLSGNLSLTRSNFPNGEWEVSLVQYNDIINAIVPEDFIVSPAYIKSIIEKAIIDRKNDAKNADFKIYFSDKGIMVGTFNLLDLK